ncbi:MAG: hypothetical protein ACKOB8_02590 [Mycobacterium sp.]
MSVEYLDLEDVLAINRQWISAPEDDRVDFVVDVATGALADLQLIAGRLRAWSSPDAAGAG